MSVIRQTEVRLAHAEMNDEYGVDFDLLGKHAALTAAEAIDIAAELVEAANDAISASVADAGRERPPAPFDLADTDPAQAAALGGAA